MDGRIPVGYVRRAHGIEGAVIVRALTDAPEIRFAPGAVLTSGDDGASFEVGASSSHNDGILVRFVGITSREEAEAMQGITLTIDRAARRELLGNEYWPDELESLAVIDAAGVHLGTVTGVVVGAAQDRLIVVTSDGREVEVPFVDEIVGEVHPSLGFVVVDPPLGLF